MENWTLGIRYSSSNQFRTQRLPKNDHAEQSGFTTVNFRLASRFSYPKDRPTPLWLFSKIWSEFGRVPTLEIMINMGMSNVGWPSSINNCPHKGNMDLAKLSEHRQGPNSRILRTQEGGVPVHDPRWGNELEECECRPYLLYFLMRFKYGVMSNPINSILEQLISVWGHCQRAIYFLSFQTTRGPI